MTFTSSDGTTFSSRSDYRKYEMETNYTFRNKTSERLIKTPGSIQGQPFNIINCQNCELVVLDHCDQVQIDDTKSCKIFIGASSESIFVRDCQDCTFTVACKQLRTRDCTNCTFYLYSKTEPIIETSDCITFACFNGAYPGHEKSMAEADLNPKNNLWFAVYDFNDKTQFGGKSHFRLANNISSATTWCPWKPANNCCPYVEAKSKLIDGTLPSSFSISKGDEGSQVKCNGNLPIGKCKGGEVAFTNFQSTNIDGSTRETRISLNRRKASLLKCQKLLGTDEIPMVHNNDDGCITAVDTDNGSTNWSIRNHIWLTIRNGFVAFVQPVIHKFPFFGNAITGIQNFVKQHRSFGCMIGLFHWITDTNDYKNKSSSKHPSHTK